MAFVFAVDGIRNLEELRHLHTDIEMAAVQAINRTARDTRADASERIRAQVNFSASYLSPSQKRLYVQQQAKRGSLEAVIRARGRPTSLARFVQGAPTPGEGVTVQVAPGKAKFMRRAFLIKLRAGSDAIETRFNMGLAIRLRPGERLENKKNVVQLQRNLYILYGPSVSQVFMANDGTGVAKDLEPQVLDEMETEFLRQFEREMRNA
jgi:hypothetical protein